MVQAIPFLLVLSLALVAPDHSAGQCVLTGKWVNDLGSNMTIGVLNEDGTFSGTYITAVSDHPDDIKVSPLLGSQQITDEPTFGFTVKWKFTETTSVFTGQCFVDDEGNEVLKTMWLLRSHVDKISDDWSGTRIGYNTFYRLCCQRE